MKRNWSDIKWIFESDGSLRDIYVQDVSWTDWEIVIELLNKQYQLTCAGISQIDKKYVFEYLTGESRNKGVSIAEIQLEGIRVHCYFFLMDQIEFDVNPKEINSIQDFEKLEALMIDVSKATEKQVTLTGESNPTFPLIKIDVKNGIQKILTDQEAQTYMERSVNIAKWELLKMKLFPKRFKAKLLKNATQAYRSTRKDENIW